MSSPPGTVYSSDFGDENIRIGEDSMHTYVSRTIVEYCVFNSTYGADSEAVSIKVIGLELELSPIQITNLLFLFDRIYPF